MKAAILIERSKSGTRAAGKLKYKREYRSFCKGLSILLIVTKQARNSHAMGLRACVPIRYRPAMACFFLSGAGIRT